MKGHFVASILNRALPKSNFEYDKKLLNARYKNCWAESFGRGSGFLSPHELSDWSLGHNYTPFPLPVTHLSVTGFQGHRSRAARGRFFLWSRFFL